MFETRNVMRMKGAPVGRSLWPVIALLIVGLELSASPALSQSCPRLVGNFVLKVDRADANSIMPDNVVKCDHESVAAGRGTMCYLQCPYASPNDEWHFSTFAMWYKTDPGAVKREMCKPSTDAKKLNSPAKQAYVTWGGGLDRYMPLARTGAEELLYVVERDAVPCPGGPTFTNRRVPPERQLLVGSITVSGDAWFINPDGSRRPGWDVDTVTVDDHIVTGPNSLVRLVFKDPSDPEGRLIIDMGADTDLDLRAAFADEAAIMDELERKKTVMDLIKGVFHYLTENWKNLGLNGRWGGTFSHSRGTEFIASYDPVTKTSQISLFEGVMTVRNIRGGPVRNLSARQSVTIKNGQMSPTQPLSAVRWTQLVSGVSRSKQEKAAVNKNLYDLRFGGTVFRTALEKGGFFEGSPIDQYFYAILLPNREQAIQDGEKLWGRFVRVPSADTGNRTPVWWHVTWVFRNGRWEREANKGVQVEMLGKVP